jgi:hypothetical protein
MTGQLADGVSLLEFAASVVMRLSRRVVPVGSFCADQL